MFGQGLSGEELTELIERDLGLRVAFPCFPLESPLGHTACCVVSLLFLVVLNGHSSRQWHVCSGFSKPQPWILGLRMHPLT